MAPQSQTLKTHKPLVTSTNNTSTQSNLFDPPKSIVKKKRKRGSEISSDLTEIQDEDENIFLTARHHDEEREEEDEEQRLIGHGMEGMDLGNHIRNGVKFNSDSQTEIRRKRKLDQRLSENPEPASYEELLLIEDETIDTSQIVPTTCPEEELVFPGEEEEDLEEEELLLLSDGNGIGQVGEVEDSLGYVGQYERDDKNEDGIGEMEEVVEEDEEEEEEEVFDGVDGMERMFIKHPDNIERRDENEDSERTASKSNKKSLTINPPSPTFSSSNLSSSRSTPSSPSSSPTTSLSRFYTTVLSHHHEGRFYKPISKIGEGTFSTVYKCKDYISTKVLRRSKREKDGSEGEGKKEIVYVAMKRIYVTSSPDRIRAELDFLADVRDHPNISSIISAFRHQDQVVIIMPFIPNKEFVSYYRNFNLSQIRGYLISLLKGLDACHEMGIIHRDVKPANFLVHPNNPEEGKLCDFGLAERLEPQDWKGTCLHSLPLPRLSLYSGGRSGSEAFIHTDCGEWGEIWGGLSSAGVGKVDLETRRILLHGKIMEKPVSTLDQLVKWEKEEWREWKRDGLEYLKTHHEHLSQEEMVEILNKAVNQFRQWPELNEEDMEEWEFLRNALRWRPYSNPWDETEGDNSEFDNKKKHENMQKWLEGWRKLELPGIPENGRRELVGYLRDDKRHAIKASRAGTRGFRAPEVLLKCPDQTTALDTWSVGVILLAFLTRRYPFFQSNDDTEALMELAAIFGTKKMQRCGIIHNRDFKTNCPSSESPKFASLHELVFSLNPSVFSENCPIIPSNPTLSPFSDPQKLQKLQDQTWYTKDCELYQAVDLMKRLMNLDLTKRYTAREALRHPFLDEERWKISV